MSEGRLAPLRLGWREPLLDRLPCDPPTRDRILAAHRRAMAEGAGGYDDPATGLFVLTATFLAERGYCCENTCRHCPYEPTG